MTSRQTHTYLVEHWTPAPPRVWTYAAIMLVLVALAAGAVLMVLR